MESSKYLYYIRNLLWCAWNKDNGAAYRKDSVLQRYIPLRRTMPHVNECVVLHHSCPLLLRCALYDVANCNELVPQVSFLRTNTTHFEQKDSVIEYKSNEHYIIIDCQCWSQLERKLVPECLKHLMQTRNVTGNSHLILLENIECLGEQALNTMKSVIFDNLHHATFVCTTSHQHLVRTAFGSGSLIMRCDYDISYIVQKMVDELRPELSRVSNELVALYRNDMGALAASMHFARPHLYRSHLESFVCEQMRLILSLQEDIVYEAVRELVCNLMSSYINFSHVGPHIINFIKVMHPALVTKALQIVAFHDVEIIKSNKIVFAYEMAFLRLYDLVRKTIQNDSV